LPTGVGLQETDTAIPDRRWVDAGAPAGVVWHAVPITWSVEPHALILLYEGQYDTADCQRALTEALSHAPGKPLLLDIRQVMTTPSAADTKERLDVMRRCMPPLQPRIAVIAADAARSGAANVMKVQAEKAGIEFRVFGAWESESARRWLGGGQQNADSTAKGVDEPAASPRGSETILLVDDDDSMRELAREVLTELGYRVIEARSARAALEAAVLQGGPIHLLMTDLMMPGMNGRELWLVFAPLHPEARALFVSGYGEGDIVRHGVLKAGTALLPKPFTPDGLALRVRQVLDGAL
jgi:CheY-like chemotaxis protein